MMPRFGGGVPDSVINPGVLLVMILTGVLMCCVSQKKAIVPFLIATILIPYDQIVVVAGLHFPILRVLVLFGMIRVLIIKGRGKWSVFSGGLNNIDKSVILLSVSTAVAGVLLFQNSGIVIFQFGELYTAFCTYFLLRCLIRDREDAIRVIRVFAYVVVVIGAVMIFEQLKGWNPYALLEGTHAHEYSSLMERDGRIRAMGPFGQPILAGTFGAVSLPLFFGLWFTEKHYRGTAMIGIIGGLVMALTCNSSTPLFGLIAGLGGLCLWPIRNRMRIVRWGIVLTLTGLQIVMKAPVWHLISRVDLSGGSSSWQRYLLVDTFIRRFADWWLIGVKSTVDWGWYMGDVCNQYVGIGESSGLFPFICFLAIIVYGLKYVGRARRAASDQKQALFLWALGSALLAHVFAFFGISYFDQTIVAWYALLAIISAIAVPQNVSAVLPRFRPDMVSAAASEFAPPDQLTSPWH